MTEYEKKMLELMTEIRDEIFRQGHAIREDGYGQYFIVTEKYL